MADKEKPKDPPPLPIILPYPFWLPGKPPPPGITHDNLLYLSANPNPDTICDICRADIGKVFAPHEAPHLPRHPNCMCYYVHIDAPAGTTLDEIAPKENVPMTDNTDDGIRGGGHGGRTNAGAIGHGRDAGAIGGRTDDGAIGGGSRGLVSHTAQTGHLSSAPMKGYRRVYNAVFIKAGPVRAADGSDAPWLIPAQVLANQSSMFNGLACYLDHPQLFGFGARGEPQVKNLFGITGAAHYDEPSQSIVGQITLYDQDPNSPGAFVAHLLDQILADQEAGRAIPPLGLSAVFYHDAHMDPDTGHQITDKFKKVESVDLVYSPGAGGYIRHALAAVGKPASLPPEGRNEMSQEPNPQEPGNSPSPLDEFDLDAMSAQLTGLNVAVKGLQDDIGSLTAEVTDPPVSDEQHKNTLEDLHARVQRLTDHLASQEKPIEGMGQAVQLGPKLSVTDPLPEMQNAWDWIFGVADAKTPPPELRRTDYLYRLLSGDQNWTGVFDERQALANANATTMAGMVVNAMNKVIVPLYDRLAVYRWFEHIVKVQPTDGSLHDMAWLQFGGIGDLPVVADGAAYSELSVDDSKETDSFTKYGGYVGITEKVIRNSDVAKIQAVPRALVVAAVQTRSAKIASIFTTASGTGPTLDQDSTVLFHADHANLATTAFSWTAWKAARIECAKHAELASSKRTGFFPKFGLFPVDLYDTALNVFGYGAGPGGQPGTANNDLNPYGVGRPGDPRPVPIAVPDWTDTNDWAYLVDPIIAPVIQMAYADNPSGNGHPPPQLYTVTSKLAGLMFTNDVLPIKVRDYFAYGVATYRGIGKRNVS